MTDAVTILNMATETIRSRMTEHGVPAQNFAVTAALWSAYLGRAVDEKDVCALMALLKISRIRAGDAGAIDHWVDIAGYAALGGDLSVGRD